MKLLEDKKLLQRWRFALEAGANIVVMRHAPKSGSDNSDLSDEGARLATEYSTVLQRLGELIPSDIKFVATTKERTRQTIQLLFPRLATPERLGFVLDLDTPPITEEHQQMTLDAHRKFGHQRHYLVTHTYYFLEKLGYLDSSCLHTTVAERMVRGFKNLNSLSRSVIYCGHSPSIEVGLERLLGIPILELGGFLNPLDSIHLKATEDQIELVCRINPIVDYVDAESQTFYS